MKIPRFAHSLPVSLAIIRIAAFVAPGHQRAEWFSEWRAELWHVWHTCNGEAHGWSHNKEEVTAFCLGAFKDALWLRWNNPGPALRGIFQLGSPSRCAFVLVILAAASMLLAYQLPGAREAMLISRYRNEPNPVMISRSGYSSYRLPTISLAEYQSWRSSSRQILTGIAFYRPLLERVRIARYQTARLSVARASHNLFKLLQIPITPGASNPTRRRHTAALILSNAAWREYLNGDPHIVGRVLKVAGEQAIVAGVISDEARVLPGQEDAWLLEDEDQLASLPSDSQGFVLADVRTSAFPDPHNAAWQISVRNPQGGYDNYDCVSLAELGNQPFFVFLFALALSCLALPATTSLPLGEYPANHNQLPFGIKLRRWVFLLTKLSLIVPLVYYGSSDLSHLSRSIDPLSSQYIQLGSSFWAFLFLFRWALRDQRNRCPVCLRLLTNPARVGQFSRNFLAWNGTELICVKGHGLLHVPDMPTSWFRTQRWLYLDSSWSSLFPKPIQPRFELL